MKENEKLEWVRNVPAGEIRQVLAEIAPGPCPMCQNGNAGMVSDPDDVNKVAVFPYSPAGHEVFIPAYLTICRSCGFVMTFACEQVMAALEKRREEKGNG